MDKVSKWSNIDASFSTHAMGIGMRICDEFSHLQ
jgi:hypothetical protein